METKRLKGRFRACTLIVCFWALLCLFDHPCGTAGDEIEIDGMIHDVPTAVLDSLSDTSEDNQEIYLPTPFDDADAGRETPGKAGASGASSRRRKRAIANGDNLWPKGIVPYSFTDKIKPDHKQDALRTMHFISDYSCVQFVPWNTSTKTLYGLKDDGHVILNSEEGKCACGVGHTAKSYICHCCERMTCLHELGHALGFLHEHQSREREGWIRVDTKNLTTSKAAYRRELPQNGLYYGFDLSTPMAYRPQYGKSPYTYAVLFPELLRALGIRTFYFFKEIALTYKCHERSCRHVTMTCQNDGYVTRIKGQCKCVCVGKLDPKTGCTTMLTKYNAPKEFPEGPYALLAVGDGSGCPGDSTQFQKGYLKHYFHKSWHFKPLRLRGVYQDGVVEQEFCVRKPTSDGYPWPRGEYCILRAGGSCPSGFEEDGFVQFKNKKPKAGTSTTWSGTMPDGQFSKNVRLEFCCRSDGWRDIEPMSLPNKKPFMLFRHNNGRDCYAVEGMRVYFNYVVMEHEPGAEGVKKTQHPYTYYNKETGVLYLPYCYYEPLRKTDCGGVFELNSQNRIVTFTSPGYPNDYDNLAECQWFFKGPEKSTLVLNFEDFDVEGKDGNKDCKDEVLVNHARVGQAPLTYCGTKQKGSIRSITNMMMVTFNSNLDVQRRGFKATVTVALAEEHCFNVDDKGVHYRGTVNYTREFEPCVPWSAVAHCDHSEFFAKDLYSGLEENYCRNPGNGLRPWCYTQAENCVQNYCDVCQLERPYDRFDNCAELLADGLCTDPHLARKGCSLTCKDYLPKPGPPTAHTEVSCSSPQPPQDAKSQNLKSSYTLGTGLSFTCASSANDVLPTCLSDSTWTPMGYSCGGCPQKWAPYKHYCYRAFDLIKNFDGAMSICQVYGKDATLVKADNPELLQFLAKLRADQSEYWIGLKEIGKQNNWRWTDGSAPLKTFWAPGEPDTSNSWQSCAFVNIEQQWGQGWSCGDQRFFICQMKPTEQEVCADKRTDCEDMLERRPTICQQHRDFAWIMCPLTCGVCSTSVESCPEGWGSHNGYCYMYIPSAMKYADATQTCEDLGSALATAKDSEQFLLIETLAANLTVRKSFWLGADNMNPDSVWEWQDGDLIRYNNWPSGKPSGKEDRCLVVVRNGRWKDHPCTKKRRFFCQKRPPLCDIEPATANAVMSAPALEESLPVGSYATYRCKDGFVPVSGDTRRACLPSQDLTGTDLQCASENTTSTRSSATKLVDRHNEGKQFVAYTGHSEQLSVTRNGFILRWEFYSRGSSVVTFQVYRRKSGTDPVQYLLVGENSVKTGTNRVQVERIPEKQRIKVKKGDLLAIYYNSTTGTVPFENCTEFPYPEGEGVIMSTSDLKLAANHAKRALISFDNQPTCAVFSFRAVIGYVDNASSPCDWKPCKNGGQCIEDSTVTKGFTCNCTDTGFTGPTCKDVVVPCEDKLDDCTSAVTSGGCLNKERHYYLAKCASSCGACDDDDGSVSCDDLKTNCPDRAKKNPSECDTNTNYMLHNCRSSCKYCATDGVSCYDKEDDCGAWVDAGQCTNSTVRKLCPHGCDMCYNPRCVDDNAYCSVWGSGECKNNPAYMLRFCTYTCHNCKAAHKCYQQPCKKGEVCYEDDQFSNGYRCE